jgi:hypothetical protein
MRPATSEEEVVVKLKARPEALSTVQLEVVDSRTQEAWPYTVRVEMLPGSVTRNVSTPLLPGHRHQVSDLLPGPQVVRVTSEEGLSASWELELTPGQKSRIQLPFVVPIPAGKVGAVLGEAPEGLRVRGLIPGSPAEVAGLRKGDVITHVAGEPIRQLGEISRISGSPGSSVQITLTRNGASRTVQLLRNTGTAKPDPSFLPLFRREPGVARFVPQGSDPYRVDLPERVSLLHSVRIYLNMGRRIDGESGKGLPVSITLTDPIGNETRKDYVYYNTVTGQVGCDPVVGGGPDQCKDTTFTRSVAGPSMELEGSLMRMPGMYEVTVTCTDGVVRRTFEVVDL